MDGSRTDAVTKIALASLAGLMPMFVWMSTTGHVREAGATLQKICAGTPLIGARFLEVFEMTRPRAATSMADFATLSGRRLQLRLRHVPGVTLRGLAVPLATGQGMIVNLSFGAGLTEAIRAHALTEADFAPTDLAVELLYLQEAKSAIMGELSAMNTRLETARSAAEHQALTDPLTGLGNRRALEFELSRIADQASRGGAGFALVHIDLDFFKAVNDTLGHAAGDHVLTRVAKILREETRRQDVLARVGGDEFVLILRGIVEESRVTTLAARIIGRFEVPIPFEAGICKISGSVGVTLSTSYPEPEPGRMLSDADLALYASKSRGRARCTMFRHGLDFPEDRRGPE